MSGFFRRLFRRGASGPTPAHHVPALPDAEEWFETDNGLPYPYWERIEGWIVDHVPAGDFDEGYNMALRRWMQRLAENARCRLTTAESPHFIVLSPYEKSGRQWVLRAAEEARQAIFDSLGALTWAQRWGKHPVLVLPERLYARYISHYYDGDYMGRSAGVMIPVGGCVHIAMVAPQNEQFDSSFRRVLAHELTHDALCELTLPRWLDEALAMHFEDRLGGGEWTIEDRLGPHFEVIGTRAILREFKDWWTEERMQGFWSGELWNSEEDEQAFCYEMARTVFRLLRQAVNNAPGPFRAFVEDADRKDGGEAAAVQHLGLSLGDLAAEFLGPGDWEPNPVIW